MNKIQSGPVHTLHGGSASPHERIWYEPGYVGPVRERELRDVATNWERLRREDRALRRIITRHPYGDVIKLSLVRYAQALDGLNYVASFLKLWALLEFLTDTGRPNKRTDYNETIRRATFPFKDHEFAGQVLEWLRGAKNRPVHVAAESKFPSQLLYRLKTYVTELILWHLHRPRQLKTFEEACEFLSLSKDPAVLSEQVTEAHARIRDLDTAAKFRR